MKLQVVITAHTSRLEQAQRLCDELGARIFLDDGTLGEPGNTRAALAWAATTDASHVIVLQDDALPVLGFLELAEAAIRERPEQIISYYLGTGRPIQSDVARWVNTADQRGDTWIDTHRLYWGVAWSIPTDHLPTLNTWLAARPDTPTDTEVGHWSKAVGIGCTHTWPCLVDHADTDSLIHVRNVQRKAWRLATVAPCASSSQP